MKSASSGTRLNRDEVLVTAEHKLPEQWERDNSFAAYSLGKAGGWVARAGVALIVLALVAWFAQGISPVLTLVGGALGSIGSVLIIGVGVRIVWTRLFS